VSIAIATAAPAIAGDRPTYLFGNAPLPIAHLSEVNGKTAIAVDDAGFRALLRDVGASLTWKPGERYVLIATAEPQIISFAVGDTRYDVGAISSQASFAPFELNGTVYVPLEELLRGLSLASKREGSAYVIQPQLASIDVRSSGGLTRIVARAGIVLHPRLISDSADRIVYAFDGVGTTLAQSRPVSAAGVREILLAQSGSARSPTTTLTLLLTPGASHGLADSDDGRDFTIGFGGAQVAAATPVPAEATPLPVSIEQPAALAQVTGIDARPGANGFTLDISVSGNATFDWHRLREPDSRFWIDLHGATLQSSVHDQAGSGPVDAVRIRQIDAYTVRLALSLLGPKRLDVTPGPNGVRITIYNDDAGDDVARTGSGSLGETVAVNPNPVASAQPGNDGEWKFAPRTYAASNPRLIVIDPGHGGSDQGAVRGDQHEAILALDMAKRLRDILVARGWQVQLTRSNDVDVYASNDSARDELQARDDVANNAGARMFVSIHVNSFINAGPRGTTTYYSKPDDVPLAQALQRTAIAQLGTKDDGIVKSKLYVTLHANMPAALVETAFLSNPDDYERLTSSDWRQKLALAIADGIAQYAGAPPPPAPSGNQ
jgi:N-acetylmuramoyl-L-alanine amidase